MKRYEFDLVHAAYSSYKDVNMTLYEKFVDLFNAFGAADHASNITSFPFLNDDTETGVALGLFSQCSRAIRNRTFVSIYHDTEKEDEPNYVKIYSVRARIGKLSNPSDAKTHELIHGIDSDKVVKYMNDWIEGYEFKIEPTCTCVSFSGIYNDITHTSDDTVIYREYNVSIYKKTK
jgi:hypothetical protein